jgi:hypothetical protein
VRPKWTGRTNFSKLPLILYHLSPEHCNDCEQFLEGAR